MSEWREIDAVCTHCGEVLEACPVHQSGSITGCEPMKYKHADTHETECFIRHVAAPYSNWGKYARWLERAEAPTG